VAPSYYGARHGLETLFQLVEYDDISNNYVILSDVMITDYPEFRHRGIMLDTARNFIDPLVIRRIIDGMAHSKV
jgi:hexosaminidase